LIDPSTTGFGVNSLLSPFKFPEPRECYGAKAQWHNPVLGMTAYFGHLECGAFSEMNYMGGLVEAASFRPSLDVVFPPGERVIKYLGCPNKK
jgi:hypothetical protein